MKINCLACGWEGEEYELDRYLEQYNDRTCLLVFESLISDCPVCYKRYSSNLLGSETNYDLWVATQRLAPG